jgi:hypothetical protein
MNLTSIRASSARLRVIPLMSHVGHPLRRRWSGYRLDRRLGDIRFLTDTRANHEPQAVGHVPNGPESLARSLVQMPSDQDLYRSKFHIDRERRWPSGN